jgi:hypothetical protein
MSKVRAKCLCGSQAGVKKHKALIEDKITKRENQKVSPTGGDLEGAKEEAKKI